MRGERILVTGATGFLGGRLLPRLLELGAEVHATTRGEPPAGGGAGAVWHRVDLEEAAAVAGALRSIRPAVVFHLASLVVGRRELELVVPAFRANLSASVHLLAAATEVGVRRLVLAGSMEETPVGDAAVPGSPYGVAKAAASLYARFFHALYGTPVVGARIFMVYGPGQRDRTKVVPASIAAALAGERPRLASGRREVDWIYVDDVVDGLIALATVPGLEGRTLDVGSGELVAVGALVERLCAAIGVPGPELGALPDRPLESSPRADVAATAAATGWRPRVGLDEGLARTIDWLRAERR